MQMIRPTQIGDEEIEASNAQAENLPVWELEGFPTLTAAVTACACTSDGRVVFGTDDRRIHFFNFSGGDYASMPLDAGFDARDIAIDEVDESVACVNAGFDIVGLDITSVSSFSQKWRRELSGSTRPFIASCNSTVRRCVFAEISAPLHIYLISMDDGSTLAKERLSSYLDALAVPPVWGDSGDEQRPYITGLAGMGGNKVVASIWNLEQEDFLSDIGSTKSGIINADIEAVSASELLTESANTVVGAGAGAVSANSEKSAFAVYMAESNDVTATEGAHTFDLTLSLISENAIDSNSSANDIAWKASANTLLIRKTNSPRLYEFDLGNGTREVIDVPSGFFGGLDSEDKRLIAQSSDNYFALSGNSQDPQGIIAYDKTNLTANEGVPPNYAEEDLALYENKIYEALTETTDRPDRGAKATPPTWQDRGFINPLRMFDGSVSSQTTADGVLEVSIAPGALVNGLALFNVSGATVRVKMEDPEEGEVYDSGEVELIDNATVTDWYSFFFEPYIELTEIALTDLPPYPDATITITVDAQGSEAAVGQVVMGSLFRIGESQYGSSVGIEDFSRKRRDEFGNFDIVERGYSDNGEFDVHIESNRTAGVKNVLSRFRATPAVYIGAEAKPSSIIYGFYFDFDVVYSNFSVDECAITIEGLQ